MFNTKYGLPEFFRQVKEHGIIDDATGEKIPFGIVMGLCSLYNSKIGILFTAREYAIKYAYVDYEDKMVHCSEWDIGYVTRKQDMYTYKGIMSYNNAIPFIGRKIKAAIMMDGSVHDMKGGDANEHKR